jgi:hypothetical protein
MTANERRLADMVESLKARNDTQERQSSACNAKPRSNSARLKY